MGKQGKEINKMKFDPPTSAATKKILFCLILDFDVLKKSIHIHTFFSLDTTASPRYHFFLGERVFSINRIRSVSSRFFFHLDKNLYNDSKIYIQPTIIFFS